MFHNKLKFFLLCLGFFAKSNVTDLYIIGCLKSSDGIGQIAPNIINTLQSSGIKINLIESRSWPIEIENSIQTEYIKKIIRETKSLQNDNIEFSKNNITLFTDTLWSPFWEKLVAVKNNGIKFAYSMTEYSIVPKEWVKKINNYFDAVLVPSDYLLDVYKNAGVKKPIFVLPLPINLNSFLFLPKHKRNSKFTFGCSASFSVRKNYPLLIKAFSEEFKNNDNVCLKLHGRYGNVKPIKKLVIQLHLKNVEIISKPLTKAAYINFMSSLDCYVFISKGEGFSITPREALAAGIPCILSNNTAHKVMCQSNLVYAIPSNIIEYAYCDAENKWLGYDYNCRLVDVSKALKEVKNNYDYYLRKAEEGRKWILNYSPDKLKTKYYNLISPRKVILGNHNEIKEDSIITNSKDLYKKYIDLIK